MSLLTENYSSLSLFIEKEQTFTNKDLYSVEMARSIFSSNIPNEFLPTSQNVYSLPYFLIPLKETESFYFPAGNKILIDCLTEEYSGQQYGVFLLHPLTFEQFRDWDRGGHILIPAEDSKYHATSTSSPRSLIVNNETKPYPFWIKLSLLNNIANGSRHIDWFSARGQVESCQTLLDSSWKDPKMTIIKDVGAVRLKLSETVELPDKLQIAFGSRKISEFGMLVREIPTKLLRNEIQLVSIAVASSPKNKPVTKFAQWGGAKDYFEFLEHDFINPLLSIFRDMVFDYGILLEPHSQNLLLIVDDTGNFTGNFMYRDFDMTYFNRFIIPRLQPSHWSTYIEGRPDRLTLNANLETRRGIMQTFHHHLLDNSVRTMILAGKHAGMVSAKDCKEFMVYLDFQWKAFLRKNFPEVAAAYVASSGSTFDIHALENVSIWEYGQSLKEAEKAPEKSCVLLLPFSEIEGTRILKDDFGSMIAVDANNRITALLLPRSE